MLRHKSDHRDRLTISRLLILTAGVGVGLAICMPRPVDLRSADSWRSLLTAVLMGISLTGPLFAVLDRGTGILPVSSRAGCPCHQRLDWGGLFWFAQGLGVLLMLPPIIAEQFGQDRIRLSPSSCLGYVLPLMGLWFLLAALASGMLGSRTRQTLDDAASGPNADEFGYYAQAWRDRFGVLLAACWAPLGGWILFDFYVDAFFK